MLEVLRQDYVVTARAKGLSERTVMARHAIRNALIPIVTVLALQFAFLLNGVIVTETVFSWPGVGRLVFDAVNQRDVPLVLTAVVLLSFLFVGANLFADLMYGFLDPRIPAGMSAAQTPKPGRTPSRVSALDRQLDELYTPPILPAAGYIQHGRRRAIRWWRFSSCP